MNNNKAYMDLGVKWGLIMGLMLGVFANIFSVINPELMFNPIFSSAIVLINLTAFILLLVMVGKKARAFTGYITVNRAFTTLLVAVLVHIATTTVFYYGTDIITRDRKEAKLAEVRQKMIDDMEAKGVDDEQIEKSLAMMDKFSGKSTLMIVLGFVGRLVVDITIAFIIASTIKRLPPPETIKEHETT